MRRRSAGQMGSRPAAEPDVTAPQKISPSGRADRPGGKPVLAARRPSDLILHALPRAAIGKVRDPAASICTEARRACVSAAGRLKWRFSWAARCGPSLGAADASRYGHAGSLGARRPVYPRRSLDAAGVLSRAVPDPGRRQPRRAAAGGYSADRGGGAAADHPGDRLLALDNRGRTDGDHGGRPGALHARPALGPRSAKAPLHLLVPDARPFRPDFQAVSPELAACPGFPD